MNHKRLDIVIPSGKCPVKLEGTDEDSVLDWAVSVKMHGRRHNRNYGFSALSYYARQFYPIGTEEHNQIKLELMSLDG